MTLLAIQQDFRTWLTTEPSELPPLLDERLRAGLAIAFVRADAEPVDPASLAHVDWDSAALSLSPTFTTLRVATNAAAIWSAINVGETPPAATCLAEAAALAIWRHNFAPAFRT